MKRLLYILFGRIPHYSLEARYSILSALRWPAGGAQDIRVSVITDDPEPFRDWPVDLVLLSEDQIRQWRGPDNFAWRVKIVGLIHALEQWGGALIYLDTDTWFAQPAEAAFARVGPGRSLMHACHGPVLSPDLTNPLAQRLRNGLQAAFPDLRVPRAGREAFAIDPRQGHMWNAGVVGLHEAQAPLLHEALALSDALYPVLKDGIEEQLALSLVLQQSTELRPAEDIVEHYWNKWPIPGLGYSPRDYIHRQLQRFFAAHGGASFEQLRAAAGAFTPRRFRRPWWLKALQAFSRRSG